jgi:hypothetical protein
VRIAVSGNPVFVRKSLGSFRYYVRGRDELGLAFQLMDRVRVFAGNPTATNECEATLFHSLKYSSDLRRVARRRSKCQELPAKSVGVGLVPFSRLLCRSTPSWRENPFTFAWNS